MIAPVDRASLARWAACLIDPIARLIPEGCGSLQLTDWGADYDADAAGMEAFIRPLWGLAPLVAGGFDTPWAARFRAGIAAGTDPTGPAFWGDVSSSDQRMVEMAGIAFAWLLAPQAFWEPLTPEERDRAADWMWRINDQPTSDNNWLFFRVMVNLALARVGCRWSRRHVEAALTRLDSFHLGDGWYRDGDRNQVDHYVPMAFHFYGLIFARFGGDLFPRQARTFRDRAARFAQGFQLWFAQDGAAIPFGRSMTYRMAQSAFWAACAFAEEEVLPWPVIRGLLMRNLRWWADRPITGRDGILTIGYAYANPLMAEGYTGAGAPYWALKSLLVLALPEDHPFWQAPEADPATLVDDRATIHAAGFLLERDGGQATLLTGGQDARQFRGCEAKYSGFAYSTLFAFSVPSDATQPDRPEMTAMDSGLAVSCDGRIWLRRGRITQAGIRDGMAWGLWCPFEGLEVESWCAFAGRGWHMRLHRITSRHDIRIAESGFAIDRAQGLQERQPSPHALWLSGPDTVSAVVDLTGSREAQSIRAAPNTNLRFPRTLIPRLTGLCGVGTTILTTAVLGCNLRGETLSVPRIPADITRLTLRLTSGAAMGAGRA